NGHRMLQPPTISHFDLTITGATPGTIAYMSPEQVRGEELVARTDLFSFGVVLYEMATRRNPFERRTPGTTFAAILQDNPDPPRRPNPQLPAELDRILIKILDKDPLRRYQHASEIREELKKVRAAIRPTQDFSGRASALDRNLSGRVRKNYWTTIVFASLVLLVALGAAVIGVRYRRSQQAPKLNNRDTVVLADFSNSTNEHIFDNVLKQALEVSL